MREAAIGADSRRGRTISAPTIRSIFASGSPCTFERILTTCTLRDTIRAQKRHGYRPSHIHFLVGAPGHRELVTALYAQGDEHIDSDTVFGVTGFAGGAGRQGRLEFADGGLSEHSLRLQAGARGEGSTGRVGRGPVADHEGKRVADFCPRTWVLHVPAKNVQFGGDTKGAAM